jgi:hypothetical protein
MRTHGAFGYLSTSMSFLIYYCGRRDFVASGFVMPDTLENGKHSSRLIRREIPLAPEHEDTSIITRLDSVEVFIGSSEKREKCVRMSQPVMCPPDAGNLNIRANQDDITHEEFDITVSGESVVCVARTDRNTGWEMQLALACYSQRVVTVKMGMSTTPTKCVHVEMAISCTWNAANSGIRKSDGSTGPDGSFFVEALREGIWTSDSSSNVCVTRLDTPETSLDMKVPSGWDFDLEFQCAMLDQYFDFNMRRVEMEANPTSHFRCMSLPNQTDFVSCAANAANIGAESNYEVVTEPAWYGSFATGTRICVRHLDGSSVWGEGLSLRCNGVGKVIIGESTSPVKCVNLDQPVNCLSSAGNSGFRLNKASEAEQNFTYEIMTTGNRVCARRRDQSEGWLQELAVPCVPQAGVTSNVAASLGKSSSESTPRRRREYWLRERSNPQPGSFVSTDPLDANVLRDGMEIMLKHVSHGWFGCPDDECASGHSQAPERFRIFMDAPTAGEPLTNGANVFIAKSGATSWMSCNTACKLSPSSCARNLSSIGHLKFEDCENERLMILSSNKEYDFIRDGDQVWIKSGNFVHCDGPSDPCSAEGGCAFDPNMRLLLKGGINACVNERFHVYGVRADVRAQAVVVHIGLGPDAKRKCVDIRDADLTCAQDSGDPGNREMVRNEEEEEEEEDDHASEESQATFSITTRGFVRGGRFTTVCARRTDEPAGWNFPLAITCYRKFAGLLWPRDLPAASTSSSSSSHEEAVDSANATNTSNGTIAAAPRLAFGLRKSNTMVAKPVNTTVGNTTNASTNATLEDLESGHDELLKMIGQAREHICNATHNDAEGCKELCKYIANFWSAEKCASSIAVRLGYKSYCDKHFGGCKNLCSGKQSLGASMQCMVDVAGANESVNASKKDGNGSQDESASQVPVENPVYIPNLAPYIKAPYSEQQALEHTQRLRKHDVCWTPSEGCQNSFRYGINSYTGCVDESGGLSAWCSTQEVLLSWPADSQQTNTSGVQWCKKSPCQTVTTFTDTDETTDEKVEPTGQISTSNQSTKYDHLTMIEDALSAELAQVKVDKNASPKAAPQGKASQADPRFWKHTAANSFSPYAAATVNDTRERHVDAGRSSASMSQEGSKRSSPLGKPATSTSELAVGFLHNVWMPLSCLAAAAIVGFICFAYGLHTDSQFSLEDLRGDVVK